ncbi:MULTISPECIES: hypothetical protein [unclassified Ruegeria]|uniref:hypothetical protein n=1 Tax=unclassified Ruegeria TaxID=2625375 RepID=UPI0014898353|nr:MULTISPECIES: hypothetical protein [unclassified Ruegeria]
MIPSQSWVFADVAGIAGGLDGARVRRTGEVSFCSKGLAAADEAVAAFAGALGAAAGLAVVVLACVRFAGALAGAVGADAAFAGVAAFADAWLVFAGAVFAVVALAAGLGATAFG